jgi:hypothetical protein
MERYCRKCGAKLKSNDKFCPDCGEKAVLPNPLSRYRIPIAIAGIVLVAALLFAFSFNQTQIVEVDNVQFEIPADYVSEPSRTDVSYDGNVKSSAMGWSNDDNYIEIGVTTIPGSGFNSKEAASNVGGSPTKMFGYSGYYQKYDDEGYSFVFGMRDKVCMIYVSNHDVFDDIRVLGDD